MCIMSFRRLLAFVPRPGLRRLQPVRRWIVSKLCLFQPVALSEDAKLFLGSLLIATVLLVLICAALMRLAITTNRQSTLSIAHSGYCKNETELWPDLELFLPLPPTLEGVAEFVAFLLPSLALFWPRIQSRLLIVTDSEATNFTNIVEELERQTSGGVGSLRITNNTSVFGEILGWNRQQWIMLWADNFTSASYVGFVDSDTVFSTRVTRSDLFSGDTRPIVRAVFGKPRLFSWWNRVPETTAFVIGEKEPFKCMSYFPVIIKLEHLPPLREHIRHRLNTGTFDQSFLKIMGARYFSQFNMMCAYLWYYHRNEYYWIVEEVEVGWRGEVTGQIYEPMEANITEEYFHRLTPRIAVHWTYEPFYYEEQALITTLRTGICYSLTEDQARPSYCDGVNRAQLNRYEWSFEGVVYSIKRTEEAVQAHLQRLSIVDKCPYNPQPGIDFLRRLHYFSKVV